MPVEITLVKRNDGSIQYYNHILPMEEKQRHVSISGTRIRLAMEHQCSSIAFPLISAGVYGCPPEIAITAATQAIREFLPAHEMEVYLVVFDRKSFKISSSLFDDVQSYLDEMFA